MSNIAQSVPLVDGICPAIRASGRDRHAQGPAERLEQGLGLMMGVHAAQALEVYGHLRMVDETLEEFAQQVDVEVADPRAA